MHTVLPARKHAFLPEGRIFQLLSGPDGCYSPHAGEAGPLVMDLFIDQFMTNKARDAKFESCIKENFAFYPIWVWEEMEIFLVPLLSWEELKIYIVESV